jgi:GAF domain-containing protein
VLGVKISGPLAADRRRIIEAAAALLAVSVKNAQLFREVKDNSVKDSLTGCFTRTHALDMIDAELGRARRPHTTQPNIMLKQQKIK